MYRSSAIRVLHWMPSSAICATLHPALSNICFRLGGLGWGVRLHATNPCICGRVLQAGWEEEIEGGGIEGGGGEGGGGAAAVTLSFNLELDGA